jgi:peptide deformylase
MRREVRLLGDPVLRTAARPVESVTDEVRQLIADMLETMYVEDGVGLAAPQVGVSERVMVVDPRDDGSKPLALVNPVIVERSGETDRGEEGCLSIPGVTDFVERAVRIVIEGLDRDGRFRRVEAEGLLARILQHEVDHLDGVLFFDRLSPLKRRLLLKRWEKVKPETARG